jgi:hypothetical protein
MAVKTMAAINLGRFCAATFIALQTSGVLY